MNTPQIQVKRLRKELAREGDVRDELERELAERITLLSEKGKHHKEIKKMDPVGVENLIQQNVYHLETFSVRFVTYSSSSLSHTLSLFYRGTDQSASAQAATLAEGSGGDGEGA